MNTKKEIESHIMGATASSQVEFRADSFAYAVFGLFPLVFSVFFTYGSIRSYFLTKFQPGIIYYDLLWYGLFVAAMLLVRSYYISFRDSTLNYRFLWTKHAIKLGDIKQARINIRARDLSVLLTTPKKPPYSLVIEPYPGTRQSRFSINIKFLSRKDLRSLLALLRDKVDDSSRRKYVEVIGGN